MLPFKNLTGDAEQDYLGDGLTENIIAELSTFSDLFVIARNSAFIFKDKSVRMQEVAEKFGVRCVLGIRCTAPLAGREVRQDGRAFGGFDNVAGAPVGRQAGLLASTSRR